LRQSLEHGKLFFREKYYGVDAWDDVNNYELEMMNLIDPEEKRGCVAPQILGIDVACGTPILELKNKLRMADIFDTQLSAFCSDAKYYVDLKTICSGKVAVDRIEYLPAHFPLPEFDYVILGRPINLYPQPERLSSEIAALLKPDGQFLFKSFKGGSLCVSKVNMTHNVPTVATTPSLIGDDGYEVVVKRKV
jgi:SAM-dependent methyltransferase